MHDERTVAYGYCHCGCGQQTTRADRNFYRLGVLKGEPMRFVSGHNSWSPVPQWREEDRGYQTPCWIWQLRIERNGYGRRRLNGVSVSAHRSAWEQAHGPVPEGMDVHHLCQQRACVNPDHLEVLGFADHQREHAVLTIDQVQEIRESLAAFSGYGACPRLAARYGVAVKTISDIKLGKTWRGV